MKNIFLNKEKFFWSSLLAASSTTVYMITVVKMAKSDGIISIVAIFAATFIGTLVPGATDEPKMAKEIIDIMDLCEVTGNVHLLWFKHLIDSHFEGIIAHATYKISAGKIEGINNKIKTMRRQG